MGLFNFFSPKNLIEAAEIESKNLKRRREIMKEAMGDYGLETVKKILRETGDLNERIELHKLELLEKIEKNTRQGK